jgi:hypothetical protein
VLTAAARLDFVPSRASDLLSVELMETTFVCYGRIEELSRLRHTYADERRHEILPVGRWHIVGPVLSSPPAVTFVTWAFGSGRAEQRIGHRLAAGGSPDLEWSASTGGGLDNELSGWPGEHS